MPALGCNTLELNQLAGCLTCLSDTELLATEALLREQLYADGAATTPRTSAQLLAAAVAWTQLTDHQRRAIRVRQLCNDAVLAGARSSCDADDLKAEIKCYCSISPSELDAINAYLECLIRQA